MRILLALSLSHATTASIRGGGGSSFSARSLRRDPEIMRPSKIAPPLPASLPASFEILPPSLMKDPPSKVPTTKPPKDPFESGEITPEYFPIDEPDGGDGGEIDPGVSCSCSPRSFDITLDYSGNCGVDTLVFKSGIADTACLVFDEQGSPLPWPDYTSEAPSQIDSVVFVEWDRNDVVINYNADIQPDNGGGLILGWVQGFVDGSAVHLPSISASLDPNVHIKDQLRLVPAAAALVMVGRDSTGKDAVFYLGWEYDDAYCDSNDSSDTAHTSSDSGGERETVEEGDELAWVVFEEVKGPIEEFCPRTAEPTLEPTPDPTPEPTSEPTAHPTFHPTKYPTKFPTKNPSNHPSRSPTIGPTMSPTSNPSEAPTLPPTEAPTPDPSMSPSHIPTTGPTMSPTPGPSEAPTSPPSKDPTEIPSQPPSLSPTMGPTTSPTPNPSEAPTLHPSKAPTLNPSISPSYIPTMNPTMSPTSGPSNAPTPPPSKVPTESPSESPSRSPTMGPTMSPTATPSESPTLRPSEAPTPDPSMSPSHSPTMDPTALPTTSPSEAPILPPSKAPSPSPSKPPSNTPTITPTISPTSGPSETPTLPPSKAPTSSPSISPSHSPTMGPTTSPTPSPSEAPTLPPSKAPSPSPSESPSCSPTIGPTTMPTSGPSETPTLAPSKPPTQHPTEVPTSPPTREPTQKPTPDPTLSPTNGPADSPTPPPIDFILPGLVNAGNNGMPSGAFPLGTCEGDCDSDMDCKGDLVCFMRDGMEKVPGCWGFGIPSYDYCTVRPPNYLVYRAESGRPASEFGLGACEGDCDFDDQCAEGLVCFNRKRFEPVPGCVGIGMSGKDYCVEETIGLVDVGNDGPV